MRSPVRGRALIAVLAVVALGADGCGERSGGEKTVVIATPAHADAIVPLLWTQTQGRVYSELMFDKLADIGPGMNTVGDAGYEPRLATRWTWAPDSLSITFHLDPRARWHDGVPVRAEDLRFAFQVYTDPHLGAQSGTDMATLADSISVDDSVTATVWYRRRSPEQFHAIAYNLVALPAHLLAGMPHDSLRTSAYAQHPIGNGPFQFVSWDRDVRFEVAAFDAFPRGRPKLDRVVFSIFGDGSAAARAVFAGDADFIEVVSPDDAAEAARHPDIRLVRMSRYDYGFLLLNMRGGSAAPILASTAVRRALTMALDRVAIVRNVYETLGAPSLGPFTRNQWTADTTIAQLPYDTAAAARAFDALGWRRGPDGIRRRNGRRLSFTMTVLANNTTRPRIAELMQRQFTQAGVETRIELLDGPAFGARLAAHTFDTALFPFSTTPSPSGIGTTWTSRMYAKTGVYNAGGYHNPVFDAEVDSGLAALDVRAARAHLRIAYETAVQDPPAIWLYESELPAAVNARVTTGPVKPDAWWQSIPHWDVSGPARRATRTAPTKAP